jgi:hypothetical protein
MLFTILVSSDSRLSGLFYSSILAIVFSKRFFIKLSVDDELVLCIEDFNNYSITICSLDSSTKFIRVEDPVVDN